LIELLSVNQSIALNAEKAKLQANIWLRISEAYIFLIEKD